ncbi:MAG: substrate-binding domain-containing protein, partial [Arenimonas sp.]
MLKNFKRSLAMLALATSFGVTAQAAEITGAGASFVFPVMSKWSADYNQATQHRVNYQSIGSGGGIA